MKFLNAFVIAIAMMVFVAPAGFASDDQWVNPFPDARITSRFGERNDPFRGGKSHHDGIDLHADKGQQVLAAAAGTVVEATTRYAPRPSDGTVVLIAHGQGRMTFYSHLATLAVEKGDRVEAGGVIGTAGSTGKVTGPHLHFEIRLDGSPVDPAEFIADWR
jgi:murein DD-endopeptidase MepM/ murein hydrolase activator NlpD